MLRWLPRSLMLFFLSALMLLASGSLLAGRVRTDRAFGRSRFPPFMTERVLDTRSESVCSLSADCGLGYADICRVYIVLPGRASPEQFGLDIPSIRSHTRIALSDADSQVILAHVPSTEPVDALEQDDDRLRWKHGAVQLHEFEPPKTTKRLTITCTIEQGIRWPDTVTFALGSMQTEKGWSMQRSLWQETRQVYKFLIAGLAIAAVVTCAVALRLRRSERDKRLTPTGKLGGER